MPCLSNIAPWTLPSHLALVNKVLTCNATHSCNPSITQFVYPLSCLVRPSILPSPHSFLLHWLFRQSQGMPSSGHTRRTYPPAWLCMSATVSTCSVPGYMRFLTLPPAASTIATPEFVFLYKSAIISGQDETLEQASASWSRCLRPRGTTMQVSVVSAQTGTRALATLAERISCTRETTAREVSEHWGHGLGGSATSWGSIGTCGRGLHRTLSHGWPV